MAEDALDPGPDGSYPNWPRKPDGSWDEERMPTGLHWQRMPDGTYEQIDLTPRETDGTPIVPPGMTPPTEGSD